MSVGSHLLLVMFAVFGHALVILLQGTTLSVAINASNRALLTVMMSNNFVELKGAVFKKFDKINLFQVGLSFLPYKNVVMVKQDAFVCAGLVQRRP